MNLFKSTDLILAQSGYTVSSEGVAKGTIGETKIDQRQSRSNWLLIYWCIVNRFFFKIQCNNIFISNDSLSIDKEPRLAWHIFGKTCFVCLSTSFSSFMYFPRDAQ